MTTNNTSSASSGGVGFFGLLAVAFIVLKLTGIIGWSWWWVLAPLWLPLPVILCVGAAVFVIWLPFHLYADSKKRTRRP
jgi:ABC-type polysaccharide/polyol phosphate export permease